MLNFLYRLSPFLGLQTSYLYRKLLHYYFMASIMQLVVGAGVVTVIGLVIFYAVYDGAQKATWSSSVTSLVLLIPLGVAAVAVIAIVNNIT